LHHSAVTNKQSSRFFHTQLSTGFIHREFLDKEFLSSAEIKKVSKHSFTYFHDCYFSNCQWLLHVTFTISIFFVVFSIILDHQILNFYIFKLILDFIGLQGKVLYKTF